MPQSLMTPQIASHAQESMLNEPLTEYVARLSKKELKPNQVIPVFRNVFGSRYSFKCPTNS